MDCRESQTSFATSRRALLLGGASFAAWAYLPKFARAADGRDPRLIVVILRGALDGLATVAPVGDPDYAGLHGSIALTPDGPHAAVMLDSLLRAASVDAGSSRGCTATSRRPSSTRCRRSYRDRSHFDGQDVLESGFAGPGRVQSGWLNRALEAVAEGRARDERPCGRSDHAAGVARRRADRRLGAGGAAAGRRRYRDAAGRTLSPPRSRAGERADARACSSRRPRAATT